MLARGGVKLPVLSAVFMFRLWKQVFEEITIKLTLHVKAFMSVCLCVCLCVCLYVCSQHNSKTNDLKVFKVGAGNYLRMSYK